jgi:hypothetical protein
MVFGANTGAELFQTGRRTAGLNDRCLEVAVSLAELFSHDLGIGQNGGGAGNLNLVAGLCGAGSGERCNGNGCHEETAFDHDDLP